VGVVETRALAQKSSVTHEEMTMSFKLTILIVGILILLIPFFALATWDEQEPGQGQTGDTTACKCKKIGIQFDKTVLGPEGDGKKGWPVEDGTGYHGVVDGKTLGPVTSNPGTLPSKYTGLAFEISCEVEGNAGACAEMQLVKATTLRDGQKPQGKTWTGKEADLDKDGSKDIDVSDEEKCEKAKGTWHEAEQNCTLIFPENQAKYGPDARDDKADGGAYERTFSYKVHLKHKIVWFDVPYMIVSNTISKKADFIAFVRGTDKKYCYVKFTIDLQRKKERGGKHTEELTVVETKNQVDSIPGVP
jgi:hypothetical protein